MPGVERDIGESRVPTGPQGAERWGWLGRAPSPARDQTPLRTPRERELPSPDAPRGLWRVCPEGGEWVTSLASHREGNTPSPPRTCDQLPVPLSSQDPNSAMWPAEAELLSVTRRSQHQVALWSSSQAPGAARESGS